MRALEEHQAVREARFQPAGSIFGVTLHAGTRLSRQELASLVTENGRARGLAYRVTWVDAQTTSPAGLAPHAGAVLPKAAAFVLPGLQGGEVDVGAWFGRKPVILTFWASWCEPCLQEAPHLVTLAHRHGEKVQVVSVSVDEPDSHDALRRLVGELAIPYPVLLDADARVLGLYTQNKSIPLTLVVGIDGTIVYRRENFRPGDEVDLSVAVEDALQGPRQAGRDESE